MNMTTCVILGLAIATVIYAKPIDISEDPDAALIDDNEQELNMFDDEESGYIDMSLLPAEDMSLIRHFDLVTGAILRLRPELAAKVRALRRLLRYQPYRDVYRKELEKYRMEQRRKQSLLVPRIG